MKKIMAMIVIMNLLLFVITGCKSKDEVVLNVYNWGDYIDKEVLTMFTEETGIKINYEEYDTNEIMYPKVKSGASSYDVIFPSDYMIEKMIKEDLLQTIDYENIPNYKYIEDRFKNLEYDPDGDYSIPYQWGTLGILYNTSMVDEKVDSWDILWDDKYSKSILMQKSVRDAFAVALKKLGYSLNTTNEAELEEAKNLLIEQKPKVLAYVVDEVKDKMIGGEAALAVIWSGEAIATRDDNPDLAYAVPKEGSNLWVDAMCIPKTSKHKKEAEMFINFLLRPDVNYMISDYIGYSTPNAAAKEKMDEELLNDPAAYPTEDILERCEVFVDVGEATSIYNEKWTEVLSY